MSLTALTRTGATIEQHRNGVHIVIRHVGRIYDYWPRRGRWRQRDNTIRPGSIAVHRSSLRSGEGLESLLAAMTEARAA